MSVSDIDEFSRRSDPDDPVLSMDETDALDIDELSRRSRPGARAPASAAATAEFACESSPPAMAAVPEAPGPRAEPSQCTRLEPLDPGLSMLTMAALTGDAPAGVGAAATADRASADDNSSTAMCEPADDDWYVSYG